MRSVVSRYIVDWQLRDRDVDAEQACHQQGDATPAAKGRVSVMRVLIVEDDAVVADAVGRAMQGQGYCGDRVGTAEHAAAALQTETFDLAIVDIGLPDHDGFHFLRAARRAVHVLPILMLTARDGLSDRVKALDLGADDYLTKPFEVLELLARARSLIRRANGLNKPQLTLGSITLDLVRREVTQSGVPLDLTHREWSILECLALNSGHLVSKERLLTSIAGWNDEISLNAIEVYISRLRTKLGSAAQISVIRGLGYRLDDPPS